MKAEADIASFLGTEACIVYAHAFSTISSVIPAFCKRGDIIVADKGANYSIRRGLEVSRSTIRWYNHNDLDDLERVMRKVVQEQAGKKLTRRFIVTEALFETTGDMNDLPRLVRISRVFGGAHDISQCWHVRRWGRLLTWATSTDRAQGKVQVPHHPGRDVVLRCARPHRPRLDRGAERGPVAGGHDRGLARRAALRRRRLLRRHAGRGGAPAHHVDRLHLLGGAAGHAGHDGQREPQRAAVEPRDPAAVPREHPAHALAAPPAQRVGYLHQRAREPRDDPRPQARGHQGPPVDHRGPGAAVAGVR